jgi:hypothetical protein
MGRLSYVQYAAGIEALEDFCATRFRASWLKERRTRAPWLIWMRRDGVS